MANGLSNINHIVVLMFENRSFDNVLGALYPNSAAFNGLVPNSTAYTSTCKTAAFAGRGISLVPILRQ
jgi:phospholipase C